MHSVPRTCKDGLEMKKEVVGEHIPREILHLDALALKHLTY